MIDPKGWTAERVREHLANAVYLEMWTIPLYLTAAYSVKAPVNPSTHRPEIAAPSGNASQKAFNDILSVVIQEMLHVELAANILNAVRTTADATPVKFTGEAAPDFSSGPACIDPSSIPSGITIGLGPANENQTDLFIWVETDRPEPGDPEAWRPQYESIGDFYTALEYGVRACWSDLYPPQGLGPAPTAEQLRQKADWGEVAQRNKSGFMEHFETLGGDPTAAESYSFSIQIYGTPADALTRAEAAMKAIALQGEGAGADHEVPPPFVPSAGPPIEIALDRESHLERFLNLKKLLGDIAVHSTDSSSSDPSMFQRALNQSYSSFLESLETAFGSQDPVGLEAMRGLGNRTLQVWQNGGTPAYTWEDPSSAYDPTGARELHACQGLNTCAGKGVNGSGTTKGDGDCATAWYHTCGQANMCKGQGGCGYPTDKNNPDPNQNSAKGNGGCGTPIPDGQVFHGGTYDGKSVWAYARKKMGLSDTMEGAPNKIRKALTPT